MDAQTLLLKLDNAINGHRHKDYHHTVALAHRYKQIVTLDAQNELVISYKPSETDIQKKQRLEIYKSKTPSVVNQVMSQFDFIKGAPRIKDNIDYINETTSAQTSKTALNMAVSRFYGRQTLQQYLEEKQKHYSLLDPNAWLIVTPKNMEGDITGGLPVCIPSASAIDFNSYGGLTEYLIVETHIGTKEDKYKDYHAYTAGITLYATQEKPNRANYPDEDYTRISSTMDNSTYRVYIYTDNTSETPATRFGYVPDPATNGDTFVGILQPVVEEFSDLVNQKSEYDLTLALHTFLKKYSLVDPCDYTDTEQPHIRCKNGSLYPAGGTCPKCKGSGVKQHATAQDVILVNRAVNGEPNEVKLSDMVHYATMPFDIVNHQAMRVDKISKEIPKYIFGVDLETKPTGAVTATEINNFYNSIYMVISPFADKISQNYIFTVTAIAQMMDIDNDLIVNHRYPRTFKMETLSELMVILDAAKKAGASPDIVWSIEQRILEIQNKDNPSQIEWAKVKRMFKPFTDLTENERIIEVAQLPINHPTRVLHGYLDKVFELVSVRYPLFLEFPQERQMEIVEVIAQEIAQDLTPVMPSLENEIDEAI
jgi:hypothetical protein